MKPNRVLIFLLAALLLSGCAVAQEPMTTTAATTKAPAAEAVTEATTEPAAVPTEPPLVLHSGLKADGSFDEGTLFIGDSLTFSFVGAYLTNSGYLGDARYMAKCGTQVTAFFDGTLVNSSKDMTSRYSPEFDGMRFDEAVASVGETVTAIYLMWGTNYTPNGTAQQYIDVVDFLLENCPNATVHLQLIPYGDPKYVATNTVNKRIQGAYDHYQELGEERVFLIDTFTAIGRCLALDGVHVSDNGNANWYQAIVDHAQENGLSQ